MKKRLVLTLAAVLSLATLGTSRARAQASLAFSGGPGKPLTLTRNAPVIYAITTGGAKGNAPLFDFQGVGNVIDGSDAVGGTLTYTINGRAARTFASLGSGAGFNSVATTAAYLYGSLPGVAAGSTVVLQAGTLTTIANFAGAPPTGGSFQTFLFDSSGARLDAVNGVSVAPGPYTCALLAVGAGAFALAPRRRPAALRQSRCPNQTNQAHPSDPS